MQVTGYGGDTLDSCGILSLILCYFQVTPGVRKTRRVELKSWFNRLVEFVHHVRRREFRDALEESSLSVGLADLISDGGIRLKRSN